MKDSRGNRILSEDDVRALISAAGSERAPRSGSLRDRLILLTIYGVGLRISEAVGLTWDDLLITD